MAEAPRVSGLWATCKFDPSQPNVCAWCGSKNVEMATRKRGTYYCSPECTKLFYQMIAKLRFLSERLTGQRTN